jgi:hypothetical protein
VFVHPNKPASASIQSISPSSGFTCGGDEITIVGSGFTGTTSISFGATRAAYSVASDTQIIARSPPQARGAVSISVTTMAGLVTGKFTYVEPDAGPVVTNVVPSGGNGSGGTRVAISGSGLAATRKIEFAGRGGFVEIHSDVTVFVISPAGRGNADIIVTTAAGSSGATATSRFAYIDPTEASVFRLMNQALVSAPPDSVAADLDGSGALRNLFGEILNVMEVQKQSDGAFGSATVDYIVRLDAMKGNFSAVLLDTGAPVATFPGTFANGVFASNDPLSTRQPMTAVLSLAALGLGNVGRLSIRASRLTFDLTKKSGQINGVVPLEEIDAVLIPAIARFYTDQLNAGTVNAEVMQQLFQATKDAQGKWLVTAAGVRTNQNLATLLVPDVQIFDLSGNYAPRTFGVANDGMSFGLGFTFAEGPS